MIDTANPALHQRPEPFDGLRMHVSAYVDMLCVPDAMMLIARLRKRVIDGILIGVDGGLGQHVFFDVRHDRGALDIRHRHGPNLPFALHYAKYRRLVRSIQSGTTLARVAPRTSYIGLVYLDRIPAVESYIVLQHQLVPNQVGHAPRRLVGDAKFTFQLLRGDSASRACHQVHRIEPQVQGRRRLMEDRPSRGMNVMTASGTRPRLTLLRSRIAREFRSAAALVAHGMDSVFRVPIAPQPFKAGCIVGKLSHELHQRILGIRGLCAYWFVSIYWRHKKIMPLFTYTVKGYLPKPKGKAIYDASQCQFGPEPEVQIRCRFLLRQ